jgi:hypothetical protein
VRHAFQPHVAVLAALSAISAAFVPAEAQQPRQATMAQPEATAHLSVDVKNGVVASVTFTSTSSTVLIEPYNAAAVLPLEADVFRITYGSDAIVRYSGMMAKRGRLSASEYLRLDPGKPLTTPPVDLTAVYDFPSGTHKYQVQYIARVTYPDHDGFWTLKSNVVAFTYSK